MPLQAAAMEKRGRELNHAEQVIPAELDYLFVLRAVQEIPFSVGRKLLISFLQGKTERESLTRNGLNRLSTFGSMAYSTEELEGLIDNLIINSLIQVAQLPQKKFWKVLELTAKGRQEIAEPKLYRKKVSFSCRQRDTIVTEEDRQRFARYADFLEVFNDAQKKAITCEKQQILCLAGAGTGKTAVLTKRAEFLVAHKGVAPQKILAITFTRKARAEMKKRLQSASIDSGREELNRIGVETFNSFCEGILNAEQELIYGRPVRVLNYADRIRITNKALSMLNTSMERVLPVYFSTAQLRGKTPEQLANIFMNDCFFIRDYFKFKNKALNQSELASSPDPGAGIVFGICSYIEAYMKKEGLRDFADQMLDALEFFRRYPQRSLHYEHLLIDEFQDVNATQMELVKALAPANLFCVGDPRQSIFGWRGSDIRYILNFEEMYPSCEVITLTQNYRSEQPLVGFFNDAIRKMGLADLQAGKKRNGFAPQHAGSKQEACEMKLLSFPSEDQEFEFVLQRILASGLPRKEIFVLARTNRQLQELAQKFRRRNISHVVRSDELRKHVLAGEHEVTLATIHASKGLEAALVFVIGCTMVNFPCKGSEHPVIEMIKIDEYDKEEEERRLFYVAISRAKRKLYLTYSGQKHTYFISESMLQRLQKMELSLKLEPGERLGGGDGTDENDKDNKAGKSTSFSSSELIARLKAWRWKKSQELGVPAFMIMANRTLEDLAGKNPADERELSSVHGLGPVKIARFGKEILEVLWGRSG